MPEPTEWYRTIETGVESLKARIGAPDARDYHLDRFLKMAGRVDEFAPTCPKCRLFQPEIDKMLRDLAANAPQILKEQKRTFLGGMEAILSHLQKIHGLISEGQNVGLWLAIGTALGLALGAGFRNPALGIPIGVALGLVIGVILDARAKKEGRVI
ncbi:MAG: hypothetical protein ABSD79_02425 [Dehalococcoidales bacterium]|jgi:hypothetical protein